MKLKELFNLKTMGMVNPICLGVASMILISSCKKEEAINQPTPAPVTTSATQQSILSEEGAPIKVSQLATMATTTTVSSPTYVTSAPLTYTGQSNFTISGVSITAGSVPAITLNNCTNVHIKLSRFVNGTTVNAVGVYLYKCTNVTIESSYFSNVASGVYANQSTMIYVANNQMLNMKGPAPRGQFVQFNQCYGGGNKVLGNKFENIMGQSYPEDGINVYRSSGTASSPITIAYNWIRGGGPSNSGGGIALGDDGGSFQTAFENILINPGQYGIAVASGTAMSIENNKIYAKQASFTNVGTFAWNQYSGSTGCSAVTISGNEVNFTAAGGYQNASWNGGNCGTINGWNNNKWGSPDVTATILPATIITMK
jgi:hypothetical protein